MPMRGISIRSDPSVAPPVITRRRVQETFRTSTDGVQNEELSDLCACEDGNKNQARQGDPRAIGGRVASHTLLEKAGEVLTFMCAARNGYAFSTVLTMPRWTFVRMYLQCG